MQETTATENMIASEPVDPDRRVLDKTRSAPYQLNHNVITME